MRKIFFLIQLFLISIFFNACFLTSIFDFGPKIDLAQSEWEIASFTLDGVTYDPRGLEEIPIVNFDTKELKLGGNTGCNTFFASYVWVDEKIEIRNSGMTRKMCDEKSMKFEQKLMEEFDGEFEVIKKDSDLILKKENLSIFLKPKGENVLSPTKTVEPQKDNELQDKVEVQKDNETQVGEPQEPLESSQDSQDSKELPQEQTNPAP